MKAHAIVRAALKSQRLVRPSHCQSCGAPNKACSDGRSYLQAHHHQGYENPLDVIWICAACHRSETPLPAIPGAPCYGEDNGKAKLTEEDVLAIRAARGSNVEIAKRYGVKNQTISDIRLRKKWKWLAEREKSHV